MLSFIVIKPTKFEFPNDLSVLDDHIIIKEFTNETLMENIIDEISLTPDIVGDTQTVYETDQNIYQICFVSNATLPSDNLSVNTEQTNNKEELNTIATYLNGDTVYGPAVLINSAISKTDYLCSSASVTVNELKKIIHSKFIHKGIMIPYLENEEIVEYEYQSHPLQYLEPTENTYGKYKLSECTFLGFQLGFFGEINSTNINKRATRLLGNKKLSGNVVLFNKLPHEFQDIDLELFNKISKLSYGPLKNREPSLSEDKEGEKINGLPVAFNKYCLLNKRYLEYSKKCDCCKNNFEKKSEKLVCTGCYRVRYHNKECQKNDWSTHKTECLYN